MMLWLFHKRLINSMGTKELGEQLTRYLGSTEKVKQMAKDCKAIGFTMSEHIEGIKENPEHFMLLITYSDLGVLGKLAESLNKLKKEDL